MTLRLRPFAVAVAFVGLVSSNLSMAHVSIEPDKPRPIIKGVSMDGSLKVMAYFVKGYNTNNKNISRARLHKGVLGFNAQVSDWANGRLSLAFEDRKRDFGILDGYITIEKPEVSPFFLTVGQMIVPFGSFGTHSHADSVTQVLGETTERIIQVGYDSKRFSFAAYGFNGANVGGHRGGKRDNPMDHYGLDLRIKNHSGPVRYNAGLHYLNDIGETDGIRQCLRVVDNNGNSTAAPTSVCGNGIDITDRDSGRDEYDSVDGISGHIHLNAGRFGFEMEYLGALSAFNSRDLQFNGQGAKPEGWLIEGSYAFNIGKRKLIWALGHQGTGEARSIRDPRTGQPLPESRYYTSWVFKFDKTTHISLEFQHDEDYDESDGGTGDDKNQVFLGLGINF
ncbi:LbtU family siderophore porin [Candidatus Parabeggiatoa sp. HSG14]|uniref:LbtU family siderophore porin n=1 Tax=Candidatus Parabeggiatoa sp. HSG14 TaxID=3055593 RepID=UPI0025A7C413|nr:LbtU family siderophore porin [Thiotrichales bacterium HSG14]